MPGYKTLHLDDVPPRPGDGNGHEWLALRHALGLRAFGINAYRAPEAGTELIEPHDEGAGGHQELYLVLNGHATFTVDDQEIDAPAGTFVFLEDPELKRVAFAKEAGTTVLAMGGPKQFEPSEWEGRWINKQDRQPE
jgi:hypothetical protein